MARNASSKPVTPDQRIRDLRKEFRSFDGEEPGPERAARLAGFTRAAHLERQLNMAMHTAALCLEDDPDAPELLVAAYAADEGDEEARLAALSDLVDLARYLDRPEVKDAAMELLREGARTWVLAADEGERRYRLRTVQSLTTVAVADEIRDELDRQH
ncbi:MAG: hypothetical protein EA387_11915 [Nitriliruptor sp.]|nr:MAG: hypothetical protein EA387_11915 [Nitriliruptor sp.]